MMGLNLEEIRKQNSISCLSLPIPGASSYHPHTPKFKSNTTYYQSCRWHRNSIKKPQSQKYKSLKVAGVEGVNLKCLRNMCFAKKHNKKGPKKMQARNTKAVRAHAEASRL
jgi:hypothetical protein